MEVVDVRVLVTVAGARVEVRSAEQSAAPGRAVFLSAEARLVSYTFESFQSWEHSRSYL